MVQATEMNRAFLDYFRCPDEYADFSLSGPPCARAGFFRFGSDIICYGPCSEGPTAPSLRAELRDVSPEVRIERERCVLPFSPDDVIENLRRERYLRTDNNNVLKQLVRAAYYLVRPLLTVTVRKQLQRAALRGWDRIPFPSWPLDATVDQILRRLLALAMKAKAEEKAPFIWFWPAGASGAAIMTHDIETAVGRDFCPTLMDLDDSFQVKSSFQVVPEVRYAVPESFLEQVRTHGFEINVHDLTHDGHLFRERGEFLRRARKINQYGRKFEAVGFRAGALYRNLDWLSALEFSYDMSVPNVAHLDPQRGGCCTVMPYFIGKILELPLTTIQDYSLFQILGNYSIALWKQQIELVLQQHGLVSFIIHPDYIIEEEARKTYTALLAHLARLRREGRLWIALPREVDKWWRQRSQMKLVREGSSWRIEGPGNERARVAYAQLAGDQIVYTAERSSETANP